MVLRVNNLDTKELDKKDLTTLHPWEYLEYRGTGGRTFIEKSKGIYLYDKDGRKLID
jgi:adenosylmethionine-8-amino-7-oxononanoate aminotransferase